MKLTIFGTGYVGLVTGACLAEAGHDVVCMDVDTQKIANLQNGILPIWEPGLDVIVTRNVKAGNLKFTCDAETAVEHGKVQFIAVGTPPDEDGAADLKYVLGVAGTIAEYMAEPKVVINKSTVPVGTADEVKAKIKSILQRRDVNLSFSIISNPEFLKEGSAVNDFMRPDRIIIGVEAQDDIELMRELYEPFNRNHEKTIFMDIRSAELTKYAANAMLATKISFMNEIANIAEYLGADIEAVRKGIGSDPRIGYHFIYPGCGYGGSCFPKDVQALIRTAGSIGYQAELLNSVENVNARQKDVLFKKLSKIFIDRGGLKGKTIAIWGLSFKPNTDDMREAPSRYLIDALHSLGVQVQAFDPVAMNEAKRIYGEKTDLRFTDDKYSVLDKADALVICTEWQQFKAPDFEEMAIRLNNKIIVDGRNLYNPKKLLKEGWIYDGIGRQLK